jgi:hypothetical protein
MPTDKSYPLDAIGNEIRRDDLVRVMLSEAALIFTVADVQPAGTLIGPDNKPLSLNGTVTITATIPVQYAPGAAMANFLVLKKPEAAAQGGVQ